MTVRPGVGGENWHCFGDSITRGTGVTGSYRPWLEDLITGGDHNAAWFQGTLTGAQTGPFDPAAFPTWRRQRYDGLGGATCPQRAADLPSLLAAIQPNLTRALVFLGTNDVIQHTGDQAAINASVLDANGLPLIVSIYQAAFPEIAIYLALITPPANFQPGRQAETIALNSAIAAFSWPAGVTLVDMHTGFDPDTMLQDAVHPNDIGDAFIAARWNAAIAA